MTSDEPVMDGAGDDMSGDGTPRAEANAMMYDGREDEVEPPLATAGTQALEEDPQPDDRTGI